MYIVALLILLVGTVIFVGDGIDENFARRVQQRHTQEILKQEIEESRMGVERKMGEVDEKIANIDDTMTIIGMA